MPDLDGLTEAVVAAPDLARAAGALGIVVRIMRQRGWRPAKGASAAAARRMPGRPLYRAIVGSGGRWTAEHRDAADQAARAARREGRRADA